MDPRAAELPLVALVGPTGSGKSELGLEIAGCFNGEIVNCDSIQLYRGFDIGAAKVPPAGRRGIPHHMIDVADPTRPFTAGEYAARTRPLLREIAARGRLPVVVGGTGFYLRALIDGLFSGPGRDDALRRRLEARETRRPGALHRILRRLDPRTAGTIHCNDVKKTVSALEVCILARRPISEMFAEGRDRLSGFRPLKIGLNPPRAELFERIDRRAEAMFAGGLLDEVRELLDRGVPPSARPFEALGYRQALDHLQGRLTLEEALYHTRQRTRQYAKRQWTWFHHEKEVLWYPTFGDDARTRRAVLEAVGGYVTSFTKKT